jgi:hypothetical protein
VHVRLTLVHYIVYSKELYCLDRLCMMKRETPLAAWDILVLGLTIAGSEVIVVEEILFQL